MIWCGVRWVEFRQVLATLEEYPLHAVRLPDMREYVQDIARGVYLRYAEVRMISRSRFRGR